MVNGHYFINKSADMFFTIIFAVSLFVGFCEHDVVFAEEDGHGDLIGRVVWPFDTPAQETVLLLFDVDNGPPPRPEEYFRLPDAAGPISKAGQFRLHIPAGIYWYGVIEMPVGKESKMPTIENWLYVSRSGDEMFSLEVEDGALTDIGEIRGLGHIAAPSPKELLQGTSQLAGKVVSEQQEPLAGFVVEAFRKPEGRGRAVFSSDSTMSDGSYSLVIPSGTYFLQLRPPKKKGKGGRRDLNYTRFSVPQPFKVDIGGGNGVVRHDFRVERQEKSS